MQAMIDGLGRARLYRTCDDPRARLDLPEGEYAITVRLPTWTTLLMSRIRSERMRTDQYCKGDLGPRQR
ncbi:hypothetical protein CO641_14085 [Lysobacteraceae bacterium NML91-0213]|nr:hypothetical protein CO641_14085 [Xanthomonadaceae bacterium NML91-0213]